ncbi:MAG: tetratricopeptide repeat protein [Betaproteobacteria bacterium]|nr:tetratricopeptide repeat protein [Betaproteobacteria bacterium]
MRIALLAVLCLALSHAASAKEYGKYDPGRLLVVSETPAGKKRGIDVAYLDAMLSDLASHAMRYPPRFDSIEDRQRAARDVTALSGMLEVLANDPAANPELLVRLGMLHSMGHNLDLAGAAQKASVTFQRLLSASPSHPRGNYRYGMFLAGTDRAKEAIPYLEKALAAGVPEAAYTLGMAHLSLGNTEKALIHLDDYHRRHPGDADAAKFVEALRGGKVEVRREVVDAAPLGEADHGTYAVMNTKGEVTNKAFRVSRRDSEWILEDRKPDGSWAEATSEADCRLSVSSADDIQGFFSSSDLAEISPTCVHSKAFAFCAYSLRKRPKSRGYVFVALTEKPPVRLRLARMAPEKAAGPGAVGNVVPR